MRGPVPTTEVMASRREQMFPALSAAQMARVERFATRRQVAAGEILFDAGDYHPPFFMVVEGSVEIVHPHEGGEELVVVHEAGEFTGEISMLAGRRGLVRGRALTDSVVLKVEPPSFRTLVQTDSEVGEVLMRAFILRRMGLLASNLGDVVLVGSRHSAATLRVQEFLSRNGHPYRYVDVELDPTVESLLSGFHVQASDVPIVICRGERVLKNPSNAEVAETLGFNAAIDIAVLRDVIVVGAGPAGLSAAVYAASEGLDVLIVEASSPGGQAGSSSKIENYLGFPTGISGEALANRALNQAEKFGAQISVARRATTLHCAKQPYGIELEGGEIVHARTIVIATGVQYRKLDVANLDRYEGVGVYYGATYIEAQRCESDEVIVIGGGNSAGQAATFLARSSKHVHVLIRGMGLAASMSRYLSRRIEDTPNITLHTGTRVVALEGDAALERVTWEDTAGERSVHAIRHVFSMAGASPNTEWLAGCLQLDPNGFVLTGTDIQTDAPAGSALGAHRMPYLFETSLPGVFAVGDVRANSVKRVASAVGEGSVCIQLVHKVLTQ